MLTRTMFIFLTGTILGAFISQNYNIPDIKTLFNKGYNAAMIIEKNMRKDD